MVDYDHVEKIYTFRFPSLTTNDEYTLEIPLKIPYHTSVKELTHRIISSFKLPCYIKDKLLKSLENTIKQWTQDYYDNRDDKLIEDAQNGSIEIEKKIKWWEKLYKDKTVEYAEPMGTSDEELFAAAYHRLVHSPSLELILHAEHKYGKDVTEVIQIRDSEWVQLTQKYKSYYLFS